MKSAGQAPEVDAESRAEIAVRLLVWYRAHRRDLPWRGGSPYAVWISEIMLQQTQVATVIPYFNRFLARFPTVEALAAAPLDAVLQHWAGLGYYARARNLHRAAQAVVERHGGRVPDTLEEITALPGIGRYTAGAILSIAYGLPCPLVDGNVVRVLSRLFGMHGDPKAAANQAALWSLAEQLVPYEAPGDFNQGLMELGALVCTPADPNCERCPLLARCVSGNSADPTALPETAPGRPSVAAVHASVLVADDSGRLLIVKRPPHGLWGGLWEFPRVVCMPGEPPQQAAARAAQEVAGIDVEVGRRLGQVRHAVTHHRITLYGFAARKRDAGATAWARDGVEVCWERPDALQNYPCAAPQTLLREAALRPLTPRKGPAFQTALALEEAPALPYAHEVEAPDVY